MLKGTTPRPLPLRIDFSGRRRFPLAGIVLLCAGLIAVAAAALDVLAANESAVVAERRLDELRRAAKRPDAVRPSAADAGQGADLRAATRAASLIRAPWSGALRAVEDAVSRDIALLVLEMDTPSRNVRIGGEARNVGAALAFAGRLRKSELFSDVAITSHEELEGDGVRVLGFTISLNLRRAP